MSFIGRYQLGQSVPLAVRTTNADETPALPDDVPVATVFNSSGTQVKQKRLPIVDRFGTTAWFLLPLFLDGDFATGVYSVRYNWTVSSHIGLEACTFEVVPGGDKDGAVIAMHSYERPHGKFLVQQLDSGKLAQGRNPKV